MKSEVIRPLQDNVILRILKPPTQTPGGLFLPQRKERDLGAVKAKVVASGPGYYLRGGRGPFVHNETQPGDVVLVDAEAGQDYSLDLNVPRHNKGVEWGDDTDEFRIVREDECLAIVDEDVYVDPSDLPQRGGKVERK